MDSRAEPDGANVAITCLQNAEGCYESVEREAKTCGKGRTEREAVGDLILNIQTCHPGYLARKYLFIDGYEIADGWKFFAQSTGVCAVGKTQREALGALAMSLAEKRPNLLTLSFG